MKIFVTGGTGFVGSALVEHLSAAGGHELTVLTRRPSINGTINGTQGTTDKGVRFVVGDPQKNGDWQEHAAQADALINLAGASIFQRWTSKAKGQILDSRVLTTRNLVESLSTSNRPNRVLLNASAIGYYGFHDDEEIDESHGAGEDFLAEVSAGWEKEAGRAADFGVRVVLMRFGVVLAPGGGALGQMIPLFRKGLGGRLGNGRQWFSWIHRRDLIEAVRFLMDLPDASGPYNLTAPNPVQNREFTKILGRILRRPTILPAPALAIKLAMGEFSSVLLKGQRVLPGRLVQQGFAFRYPDIQQALTHLLA